MAVGAGRRVGAWTMAVGAFLVLVGVAYLTSAVDAVDRQAAALDPSESRFEQAFAFGAGAAAVATTGLAVFLLGAVPYAVSAIRVSRRGLERAPMPRVMSLTALAVVIASLFFVFLAPSGPFVQAVSLASGGGGPAGATQIEFFEGEMTAASLAGQSTDERIHRITPVASYGAIKLRFFWEGAPTSGSLAAILEASDGQGGWNELASTDGSNEAELAIGAASYPGDLRVRVVMTGAGVGEVSYEGALSFDPTP